MEVIVLSEFEKVSEEDLSKDEKELLRGLEDYFEIRKRGNGMHWVYDTEHNEKIIVIKSPHSFSIPQKLEEVRKKYAERGPRAS